MESKRSRSSLRHQRSWLPTVKNTWRHLSDSSFSVARSVSRLSLTSPATIRVSPRYLLVDSSWHLRRHPVEHRWAFGWISTPSAADCITHPCATTSHRLTFICKEASVSLHLIARECFMVGCNLIARWAAQVGGKGAPLEVGFVVRVQVADRPDSHPEMTFRYLRCTPNTALAGVPSVKPLRAPRALLQGVAGTQVRPLHSESGPESKRLLDHWVRDAP